jgi:flavin reductase (DIM6/NTAB) family NADH-FMN oxidoreductase RutF
MYSGASLTPSAFRVACGLFPTGVTVVTAKSADDEVRGMTLNAFMSVSLDPYLVLISVADGAHLNATLAATNGYAISILHEHQRDISTFFAGRPDALAVPPFAYPLPGEPPVIEGALAWMQCDIVKRVSAGDHSLWVGSPHTIWTGDFGNGKRPLVFSQSAYQSLRHDDVEPIDWSLDYLSVARLP